MPVERRERVIAIWLGSTGNGRNPMFNGRRQPSSGGTSRMTRECQVRFCERLGVKFPGPTRQIAIFDIDSELPAVKLIQTAGSGGASVKDLPGGRFMVIPQRGPRELHQRADGSLCQVGQLAVIDALAEKVAAQVPVYYGEPTCRTPIAGT